MKNIYAFLLVLLLLLSGAANAQQTWYTLGSGDWDNPVIWTLDPAGMVSVNPTSTYPQLETDNIVILSSQTVTMPDGNSPYNSPVRDVSITCATLKVEGRLDLRKSDRSTFDEIKGSGTILMADDNFPAGDASDFTTKGQGQGTAVYYGSSSISLTNGAAFFNIEVNLSVGQNLEIDRDLNVNGNLTVKQGSLKIGKTLGVSRSIHILGDVTVEANGRMDVGSTNSFHWLNIYGNFTNNGSIDFAQNPQYTESVNGAVKVKFKGSKNTTVVINGTTDFYRFFVDKGSDKTFGITVSATNTGLFKLYGPVNGVTTDAVDGSAGWQKLPVVIENGTLQLGDNIELKTLGENINGTAPKEFTIPETGQLIVNGATVATSRTLSSNNQYSGVCVQGQLKIKSGEFTTPAKSSGLTYIQNISGSGSLVVEGGILNLTNLRRSDSNGLLNYFQSGGTVNFLESGYYTETYGGTGSNAVFSMPDKNQVFSMSGGEMYFAIANSDHVTGIYINAAEGNYNVSGGIIRVKAPSSRDFKILSSAPLYNLTVQLSSKSVLLSNIYGGASSNPNFGGQTILNDLSIEAGGKFGDNGNPLAIGGDFNIAGTYTQSSSLVFNGAQDGAINNDITGISLPSLLIDKDKHPTSGQYYKVSLTGTKNISIAGTLKLQRGVFDVVNYWPTVADSVVIVDGNLSSTGTGGLELKGTKQQVLKGKLGKDYDFGRLSLNNANYGIKLASDVDVAEFAFATSGTAKVDMGVYNFNLSGALTNSNSSRYFYTAGNASDGGLSLGFTITSIAETLATFHVGATDTDYAPAVVKSFAGQSTPTSGFFTVIPVKSEHPSTTDPSNVLAYYWKTKVSGFSALENGHVALEFTSYLSIKGYKVAYLDGYNWTIGTSKYTGNNDKTLYYDYTAGNADYIKLINSDYTAGLDNGNGKIPIAGVKIFRSTGNVNWHSASSWRDQDNNAGIPGKSDVAIVQAGHTITIANNTALASQVQILGVLKVKSGTSAHAIDIIKGSGRLVYENNVNYWNDYTIISGDHSDFCNNVDATIEFTGTAAGPRLLPKQDKIANYPNLVISGSAGTAQLPQDTDLRVLGDLTVNGVTFDIKGINNGEVEVYGDVIINTGTLEFPEAYNHHMTIFGDVRFTGTGTFLGNVGSKLLTLYGNIALGNGNFNFTNTDLLFTGDNSALVSRTSAGTIAFNRIYINKSVGEKVEFTTPFALNGPANDATKSLVLQSGECHLNASGIDIKLNSGSSNTDFGIPNGTTLRVDNGSIVRIDANGTGSGVSLGGKLIVENSGQALFNQGTDNYIEFNSGGGASISVSSGGVLNVGSQIRRSTSSDAGVLSFAQNGGLVTVGSIGAPEKSRGVFEILGAGTSFTQGEDDVITINKNNGSSAVASLYFYPETTTVSSGSGFVINAAGEFGINSDKAINAISLTNGAIAKLYVRQLSINQQLSIGTGTTFNQNGFDLYIKGNLTNNGTFNGGTNTTFFKGTGAQSVNGTTSTLFYNLEKSGGTGELSIDLAGVEVSNNLIVLDGVLNTKTFNLTVKGDVVNYGSIVSGAPAEVAVNGLILGGTTGLQGISGDGNIDCLTINNQDGVNVPLQAQAFTIGKQLKLQAGVFDIGRNLLTIKEGATIVDGSGGLTGFDNTNMVQTNLSFTDAGIQKFFGAPYVGSFVYPIGSFGKYTPVTFTVLANTASGGSIRVKAANEPHVSVLDKNRVLQYNWSLDANNISGLTADVIFQYLTADAWGDKSKYIDARIFLSSDKWTKNEGSIVADQIKYRWTNANDLVIDGDYTAGEADAIPDVLPSYITMMDGSWDNANIWAKYDLATDTRGVVGDDIPPGGPSGAIIYVEHMLTLPTMPSKSSYRTHILQSGTIDLGNTLGHRLGYVSGTGVLKFGVGSSLPAGIYDQFVSSSGGTVQYDGTSAYDVMGGLPRYNNVWFTGSGDRRMSSNVIVGGSFKIEGPNVVHASAKTIFLSGNLIFNSGTYSANENSRIAFVGSTQQKINTTVNFTGTNALYDLEVDNVGGVLVEKPVEIMDNLYLTRGIIEIAATGSFTMSSVNEDVVIGGSASSYVDGLMYKNIASSGGSFDFPVGDDNSYGNIVLSPAGASTGIWGAQYFKPNTWNPAVKSTDVAFVSTVENWKIEAPRADEKANVKLRWDQNSGVVKSNLQLIYWTGSEKWDKIAHANEEGDDSNGTVQLAADLSFGYKSGELAHYFTFGAKTILPYTWEGDDLTEPGNWFVKENWSGGYVPNASANTTIVAAANMPVINSSAIAQVNDLTIAAGASLTLDPGAKLTVKGNLTTNNKLIVKNTVAEPVSIIVLGTVAGTTNIQWPLIERSWWYIGHSVTGVTEADYVNSFGAVDFALNQYTGGAWNRIAGTGDNYTGTYAFNDPVEGYSLTIKNSEDTLSYNGVLNTAASYTSKDFNAGWYLVANPYPSYMDISSVGFDMGNFSKTVYIRRNDNQVSTYNTMLNVGLKGGSKYVSPGQCVWLRTYTDFDKVTISNAVRTHAPTGNTLKGGSVEPNDRLRLMLESEYGSDESVVIFNQNGSETYTAYDSEKLMNGGNIANLYSLKGIKEVAISSMPELKNGTIVPLAYKVAEKGISEMTFKATNLDDFMPEVMVYLEDKVAGITIDLRETSSYTFTPSIASATDRFELRFETGISTAVDEDIKESVTKNQVLIYGVKQRAYVKVDEELLYGTDRTIKVYNVAGQLMATYDLNSVLTEFDLPQRDATFVIRVNIDGVAHKAVVIGMD